MLFRSVISLTPESRFEANPYKGAFCTLIVRFRGFDRRIRVDKQKPRTNCAHASRRVEPGQAEIHTLDTDVIYVVDGSATLVTGGKAVDAKEIAPNEIRGTKIEGGQEHQISKGEVIVIPNGVPHQFTAVTGELHYFVCKPTASAETHLTAR